MGLSFLLWGEPGVSSRGGCFLRGGCETAPSKLLQGLKPDSFALWHEPRPDAVAFRLPERSRVGAQCHLASETVLADAVPFWHSRRYQGVEVWHSVVRAAHSVGLSFLLWGEPGASGLGGLFSRR
jgi:hypothetical protein